MRLVFLLLLVSKVSVQGAAFTGKRGAHNTRPYPANKAALPQPHHQNTLFSSINHPDSDNKLLIIDPEKNEDLPEQNPFRTTALVLSFVNFAMLAALITIASMGDNALESSGAGPTNTHGAESRREIITLQETRPVHQIQPEDLSWQVDASAGFYFF